MSSFAHDGNAPYSDCKGQAVTYFNEKCSNRRATSCCAVIGVVGGVAVGDEGG